MSEQPQPDRLKHVFEYLQARQRPVTNKTRWLVFKRDDFRCRYCGRTASDGVKLTIDHVVPLCHGGRNSLSNLMTACVECNAGKGGTERMWTRHGVEKWED